MFMMFFRERGGIFNQILAIFKIKPVTWLNSKDKPALTLTSMFIPMIWQYIGFYFVIFLTALSTISEEMLNS